MSLWRGGISRRRACLPGSLCVCPLLEIVNRLGHAHFQPTDGPHCGFGTTWAYHDQMRNSSCPNYIRITIRS